MNEKTETGAPGGAPITAPGDDAAPGTPGTGENVCRKCSGSGRIEGEPCQACQGTGKVVEAIGGA